MALVFAVAGDVLAASLAFWIGLVLVVAGILTILFGLPRPREQAWLMTIVGVVLLVVGSNFGGGW